MALKYSLSWRSTAEVWYARKAFSVRTQQTYCKPSSCQQLPHKGVQTPKSKGPTPWPAQCKSNQWFRCHAGRPARPSWLSGHWTLFHRRGRVLRELSARSSLSKVSRLQGRHFWDFLVSSDACLQSKLPGPSTLRRKWKLACRSRGTWLRSSQ